MKVLLVSGFLGAGKTTFIRELARQATENTAILENEVAPVGVDGRLLTCSLPFGSMHVNSPLNGETPFSPHNKEKGDLPFSNPLNGEPPFSPQAKEECSLPFNSQPNGETANIWEMTDGCICCSAKGDFASSVLTIANSLDPELLIVEPTGVAFLSQVIKNLQQIAYARIQLLAPVTVVDGKNGGQNLSLYPELAKDQICHAKTLVVSKTESADAAQKAAIKDALHKINPSADILFAPYSSFRPSEWEEMFTRDYSGKRLVGVKKPVGKPLNSFSLTDVRIDDIGSLILFLEGCIRGRFGDILRAKGTVSLGKTPVHFDLVENDYTVIGQDLADRADTKSCDNARSQQNLPFDPGNDQPVQPEKYKRLGQLDLSGKGTPADGLDLPSNSRAPKNFDLGCVFFGEPEKEKISRYFGKA